jgi:polyisoprenoid-binding protein YceI
MSLEVCVKFYRVLAVPALLAASSAAFAAPSDYRFYMAHTQIFFSVSHLNYSHPMGRMHVKGGYFSFDPDDWSSAKVDVTIDIASLDMGDEAWSNKMRSAFFDVTTYPTAHYVSTKVEKTGERTGVVHGNLTLLGKTHPVDLQLTFNRAAADGYSLRYIAGFAATAAFKRSTWGMTRAIPDNGDDVTLHLEVEGIRDGDAQKQAPADSAEHP